MVGLFNKMISVGHTKFFVLRGVYHLLLLLFVPSFDFSVLACLPDCVLISCPRPHRSIDRADLAVNSIETIYLYCMRGGNRCTVRASTLVRSKYLFAQQAKLSGCGARHGGAWLFDPAGCRPIRSSVMRSIPIAFNLTC